MFKFSTSNKARIGKTALLGATILMLGMGSAYAKNSKSDNDDRNNNQAGNSGSQTSQVNYGAQVNPNTLLGLLFPATTPTPAFDKTDVVDFSKDTLTTPCLLIKGFSVESLNGSYFTVKFHQRLKTSASEWYVTTADPEKACSTAQTVNPFQPVAATTDKSSTGSKVRNYHTPSTDPSTLDKTAFVDFTKAYIDIPCLLIQGFAPSIDGTFYHIQMEPQQTIKNISDWKVSYVKEAKECNSVAATDLFK